MTSESIHYIIKLDIVGGARMYIDGKLIGNKLKSLRIKNCLSIDDVSKKTGLTKMRILRYENDSSNLGLETLEKLLILYGENIFSFFDNIREYNHI